MLAPPSPPPEPAVNTPPPPRSRRTGAAAPKPLKPSPKKVAAGASPRRRSKPVAARGSSDAKPQMLVVSHAASGPQPAAESGMSDAPPAETGDDTPADLSAAITAWQQFDAQAEGLLVGRAQADNMVQLLSSQVESKQPEQVIMEVGLWLALHCCSSGANKPHVLFVGISTQGTLSINAFLRQAELGSLCSAEAAGRITICCIVASAPGTLSVSSEMHVVCCCSRNDIAILALRSALYQC